MRLVNVRPTGIVAGRILWLVGAALALILPSTSPEAQSLRACVLGAWPSLVVEVRDGNGRPVARGATLESQNEVFVDRRSPREAFDTLYLHNRSQVAGTFRVRVTKPGYAPAETSGVHIPGGACGAFRAVTIAMTLRELPHAPRVRSVVIFMTGMGLGPGEIGDSLTAYVDAAPGEDTSVIWSSSDPAIVTVSPEGTVRSRSLRCKRTAVATATARADPRRRAHVTIEVFGYEDTEPYCVSRRSRPDGAMRANLASVVDWSPGRTGLSGSAVPFLNDHLQAGVAWSRFTAYTGPGGRAEALATFHIGRHWKSRPHIGLFALSSDELTGRQTSALGARAGWTYFTSPAVAARAEVRYWNPSTGDAQSEVLLGFDPYVLGSARISRRPPAWGVFDVRLAARAKLTAPRDRSAELMLAPFLTRWIQVGGVLTYVHDDAENLTAHSVEGFGRYYVPIESRVAPFVGASVRSIGVRGGRTVTTPGVLAGARAHLNRDVALEVLLRRTSQHGPEPAVAGLGRTTLRIGIVTQLRTRGRIHAAMF